MTALVEIQSLITKYTDITSDIIKDLDSIEYPRIHPISVGYLFIKRFHYNSLAVNELISNYTKDRNFKLPLFIVLRTCISDFLYLNYVNRIIRDSGSDENIEQEIKYLLADNLEHRLKELNDLKKNKEISPEKFDLYLSSMKQIFPEFFDGKTGELMNTKTKGFKEINRILKQDKQYSLESKAYDQYILFSKFEHIGALTFDLDKNYDYYVEIEVNSIVMTIVWIVKGLKSLIPGITKSDRYISRLKGLDIYLEKLIELKN